MTSSSCRGAPGAGCRWAAPTSGGISSTASSLRRRIDGTEVFGVTTPLITTADGAKMGKTAQGAVWLNADAAQPVRLLAVLAEHRRRRRRAVPAAVHRFAAGARSRGWRALPGAEINQAKIVLATEATAMLHGARRREAAAETAETTFAEGGAGEDLPTLHVGDGITIARGADRPGLRASNGEAKRKIAEGAVRLDDVDGQRSRVDACRRRQAGEAQPGQEEARAARSASR